MQSPCNPPSTRRRKVDHRPYVGRTGAEPAVRRPNRRIRARWWRLGPITAAVQGLSLP